MDRDGARRGECLGGRALGRRGSRALVPLVLALPLLGLGGAEPPVLRDTPRPDVVGAGDGRPGTVAAVDRHGTVVEPMRPPAGTEDLGPREVLGEVALPPVPPGGRPGPHNTGVPAGTVLRVHEGDLMITTAGTVIDGLDVRGFITVRAPNVTIRNTIVRGRATTSSRGLVVADRDTASVTITDSELAPTTASPWIDGIRGWNITARRVNVHNVIDSVHIYGPNVTVENSWLHSNVHFTNDPAWGGGPSHDDNIQIQRGHNIRIRNNTISGATNAAIQLTQDQGTVSDVQVTGNYLDGGACTINFAEKGRGPFQDITLTHNTFGRTTRHPDCAIIAPTTTAPGLTLAGNAFIDARRVLVRPGG